MAKITSLLTGWLDIFSLSLFSLSVPSSLFSLYFYSPRIQPLLEAEGTRGRKNKSNQILLSPFPECRETSEQSGSLASLTHLKPASTGLYHCSPSIRTYFFLLFSPKDWNNPVTSCVRLTLQHTWHPWTTSCCDDTTTGCHWTRCRNPTQAARSSESGKSLSICCMGQIKCGVIMRGGSPECSASASRLILWHQEVWRCVAPSH